VIANILLGVEIKKLQETVVLSMHLTNDLKERKHGFDKFKKLAAMIGYCSLETFL
jgi:hypothetical protein